MSPAGCHFFTPAFVEFSNNDIAKNKALMEENDVQFPFGTCVSTRLVLIVNTPESKLRYMSCINKFDFIFPFGTCVYTRLVFIVNTPESNCYIWCINKFDFI